MESALENFYFQLHFPDFYHWDTTQIGY